MHVRFEGRSPALRLSLTVDAADDGQLILDASRLTWASPADLAGMAAWAAHGSSTTLLVLPEDIDAGSYLRRMDLLKVLSDGGGTATGTLVPEGRRDLQDRLIELRRIDDQASIDAFASAVFRLVDVNSGRHQAAAVHSMVGELLDNIRHARSPVGAFGAAQVYTGATSGQTGIEVAVANPGRGILASLRDNRANREIDSCSAAVKAALRDGVTGELARTEGSQPVHGVGLTRLVRGLHRAEGSFILRSGDGVGRVTGRSRHVQTSEDSIPGTWAWFRISPPNSHSED